MKVDPYKNYGGKDRVSPVPQRTKTYFDRDDYTPYGSGQSQQSSFKQAKEEINKKSQEDIKSPGIV